jgi:hypothetical protein
MKASADGRDGVKPRGRCSKIAIGEQGLWRRDPLFLLQRVALLDQLFQLFGLVSDAIGVTVFVLGARERGRLLDQLPDIVSRDRNAPLELRKRKGRAVVHGRFLEILSWDYSRTQAETIPPRRGNATGRPQGKQTAKCADQAARRTTHAI